jgi:hypothetical protein
MIDMLRDVVVSNDKGVTLANIGICRQQVSDKQIDELAESSCRAKQ